MSKKALIIFIIFINTWLPRGEAKPKNWWGGYISIGIQIGKESNGNRFWGSQITFAKNIPIAYRLHEKGVPYVFPGVSLGFRRINKNTLYYIDGQLSVWTILTGGFGVGKIWCRDEMEGQFMSAFRKKYWCGIGVIPCLITYDNYKFAPKSKQKFVGLFINPFIMPIFDDYFHP